MGSGVRMATTRLVDHAKGSLPGGNAAKQCGKAKLFPLGGENADERLVRGREGEIQNHGPAEVDTGSSAFR